MTPRALRAWAALALLPALLWLSAAAPRAAAAPPGQGGAAYFETAACPFDPPANDTVDCGYLIVPEDRANPVRSLRLAVAILRSRNPNPQPDPLLYLSGGPGDSALAALDFWLHAAPDLRADRDVILLDQRGTGSSLPSLKCWEFQAVDAALRAQAPTPQESVSLEVQAAQQCRDRLTADGVNLAAYNTAATAADVKDLRLALGLPSWNLFGHSYGARVALTVMRDYPAGVRSVVLNAALPLQANWFEEAAANADRGFNQLFTGCALDRACATAFPELARRLDEVVARLDAAPLVLSAPDPATRETVVQWITGQDLLRGGFDALYDTELIPYLPLAVAQISAGNAAVVEGFATALNSGDDGAREGVWFSVMCHDEAPFNDPAVVAANAARYPRLRDFVLSDSTLAVCAVWGAGQAGALETTPVRSDIPTLVIAGEYDPIHPPAWSQLAASTLRNNVYFELRGASHDAGFTPCGQALTAQFVSNPGVAPNAECARALGGPAFVTQATINPGVYRLASRLLLQGDYVRAVPFAVCALLFASALLYWPIDMLRALRKHAPRAAWAARWLAALVATLHLAFLALLLIFIINTSTSQPYLLLFGLPPEAAPLFAVPWVALALSVGLALLAWPVWREGYWSPAGRVHYTLVTLASFGFVWLLLDWGLLPS
ncbi:MAG: alpha/beta fold hydrolase [Anaerolineales bacterium]|nr:alpha/beta fold hydrolase [Anaerolineales bacterium]